MPSSRSRWRSSICIVSRSFRSSALNGSSSSSSEGFTTIARATAMRCCCPPESASTLRSAKPSIRTSESASRTRVWISALATRCAFNPNATFSATVRWGKQRVVLEYDADVAPVRRDAREVAPADRDRPEFGNEQSGDQAQKRGLAAARRAEQRHELAAADRDAEILQHHGRAETLGDAGNLEVSLGLGLRVRGVGPSGPGLHRAETSRSKRSIMALRLSAKYSQSSGIRSGKVRPAGSTVLVLVGFEWNVLAM